MNKEIYNKIKRIALQDCSLPCAQECSYPNCKDDITEDGKNCPIGIARQIVLEVENANN